MKIFALFILHISSLTIFGQDSLLSRYFPMTENNVRYEKTLEIKGISQKVIFQRANIWVLHTDRSEQDGILKTDDVEMSSVMYKDVFHLPFLEPNLILGVYKSSVLLPVYFSLKIYCKAGRARVVLDDISFDKKKIPIEFYREQLDMIKMLYGVHLEVDKETINKDYMRQYESEFRYFLSSIDNKFRGIINGCIKAISTKSESEF